MAFYMAQEAFDYLQDFDAAPIAIEVLEGRRDIRDLGDRSVCSFAVIDGKERMRELSVDRRILPPSALTPKDQASRNLLCTDR